MKETLDSILQFSKDTFPKTTLETQKERFEEEYEEMAFAKTESEFYDELGDMVIVAIRVLDFDLVEGAECFKIINDTTIDPVKLRKSINKKMAINRKRAKEGYWVYDRFEKQYIAKHKTDYKEFDTIEEFFADTIDNKE